MESLIVMSIRSDTSIWMWTSFKNISVSQLFLTTYPWLFISDKYYLLHDIYAKQILVFHTEMHFCEYAHENKFTYPWYVNVCA